MQKISKLYYWFPSFFLLLGAAMHDPTRPPHVAASVANQASPLKVSAIFIRHKDSLAIINGQVVKLGETIDTFRITQIQPYSVELIGPDHDKVVLQLVSSVKH